MTGGGASRISRITALAAAAALLLPTAAWADAFTPESGGSPNADAIDSLYKLVLYIALAVFVAVEGTLVYALIAFRARRGRVAAQISGHTRLEIGWTVGAALILVAITTVTFMKLPAIAHPAPSGRADAGALHVEVRGEQYIWRFRYPGGVVAYADMVVPTDTTVKLDIVSRDVAHSWWVPKLGGKADAIPGSTNHTWFRIARPGVFRGQCAELCGRNHADMITHVRAVSPERFRAWLEEQQRGIDEAHRLVAPGSGPTPVRP